MRAVVLVEGESDSVALRTLAHRRGLDLVTDGVQVVAMGGITNAYVYLRRYESRAASLAGLYDAAEQRRLYRALARCGMGTDNFFGCDPDLEYELIRALGVEAVEGVIEREGEGRSLQRLARMPAQQGWPRDDVLHRFIGSRSGRKARYARLLVEALDLSAVPQPLDAVLECALSGAGGRPARWQPATE